MRFVYRWIFWGLLLLGGFPASGQETDPVLRLDGRTEVVSFPTGLSVLVDSSRRLTVGQLVKYPAQYGFRPSGWPVPVAGPTPHWIRFAVFNPEPAPLPLLLELDHPFLEGLNAYLVVNQAVVSAAPPLSWRTPFAHRPVVHRNFVLPLTFPARQLSTVYLRLDKSPGTHRFPIRLWQPAAFQAHDLADGAFWGLVLGWLLFAIALGVFLFLLSREWVYAFYSFYIAAHGSAVVVNEGLLGEYYLLKAQALTGNDFGDVCIGLIIGSSVLFIRALLDVRTYTAAWLYRLSDGFLVVWGAWLLGYFVEPLVVAWVGSPAGNAFKTGLYWSKYAVYFVGGAFAQGFIVHALVSKRASRQAWLYLAAFLPVLVVANVFFYGNFVLSSRYAAVQMQSYATAIVFETVVLLFGLAYRFKTYRDERERLLREQNEAQRTAYQLSLQAQHRERQRLAKDLHDGIGLDLAVLKLRMAHLLENHPPATLADGMDGCLNDLDRICADLRQVSHALLPTDLQHQGLVPSLQHLVGEVAVLREGLEINFTHGLDGDLPEPFGQSVYQMAKELLNNALKHAGATVVDVELYQEPGCLRLTVADDGQGYDPARLKNGEGIGLRNIRASAEALQGSFEITPKPTGGMVHRVVLPVG